MRRAALGFVHVVGGNQRREAVGRHVVDEVPELASRLDVDAGGRLVEQQQARLVEHAGGEREALFPAARQLAGELAAPILELHALDDRLDRSPAVLHLEDAGDEIEILEDREVVVQTEALRHIADFAADFVRLANDVVADALSGAGVGDEQPAQHADGRRLAAAVGAREIRRSPLSPPAG